MTREVAATRPVRRLRTARRMVALALRALGPIAAAFALAGCVAAPYRAGTIDQARRQFASAAFCPVEDVIAERVSTVPPAPPAVARDPERLEMWRRAFGTQVDPTARQTIAVSGCGESETLVCWDRVGYEPGRRGRRQLVYAGTSCNETLDGRRSAGLEAIDRARAAAEENASGR
jgi:hypothetical protein